MQSSGTCVIRRPRSAKVESSGSVAYLRQPQYRLRVQDVRVYYDVEQATVHVLGVVEKSDTHRWLVEVSIPDEGSST